jgi:signal transduction histidine kinase
VGDFDRARRQANCRCGTLRESTVYIRVDIPAGRDLVLPPGVTPAAATGLEQRLRTEHQSRPELRRGLFVAHLPGIFSPGVVAYEVTLDDDNDQPRAIYGIAMDPSGVEELFEEWHEDVALLPAAIADDMPNDSLVSLDVRAPTGELLFASQSRYPADYASTDTLSSDLGSLLVQAAVRPDAAEYLIIGGLPASRIPLLSTLLILTLCLGVAALVQVHRQQHLARLREDFVSGVSHEFRTPLTQIKLFAELLRDGKLEAEGPKRRATAVINREASRLTHLVENVLRFSAIQHGTSNGGQREEIDVREVVDEILEAFAPLADDRGVRLESNVRTPCVVEGSRTAVYQILTNLLDNALKYGPDGQTVRVTASRETGSVMLSVEDEGPGVPAAERTRIWEPYRRLPADVAGDVRGSGIGLAVVAELASELGGRAWVEDADGRGSRFVVELSPWEGPTAVPSAS